MYHTNGESVYLAACTQILQGDLEFLLVDVVFFGIYK